MTTINNSTRPPERKPANYEKAMAADGNWALTEGSKHFEEKSLVFATLRQITAKLEALGIPYAIVGGMALFMHGYRRFTDDIDLLVTQENLAKIHAELDGLGYLPPFAQSKHLRDTATGVRIEFLTTGGFPGDGKPKPVAFPDPAGNQVRLNEMFVLSLPRMIELKLASGMSNASRLKDLADVMELCRQLHLDDLYAENLHPSVAEKFRELCRAAGKPDDV